ncbi:MAG TPA: sigma-70 family RNA polymerase sigma factor [Candidatus Sulfotelmatobacter sp.]|nr:sigma-70 family RNA polymerase sigma factor [Candidatus Sulfotelmatobacter sp.]
MAEGSGVDQDDSGIVQRCLAGDERAYRELVEHYQKPVYTVAFRMLRSAEDAEDITQETFVRVFRALDRYDPSRSFEAWLFTITTRLCIDLLRRRKVRPVSLVRRDAETDEEQSVDVEDPGLKPDELTSHAEEERRTRTLIDSLPPHYRIVVVLRHQQDMSYEEIAEALHLPLGTVKARIHRARALLKDRLQEGSS